MPIILFGVTKLMSKNPNYDVGLHPCEVFPADVEMYYFPLEPHGHHILIGVNDLQLYGHATQSGK